MLSLGVTLLFAATAIAAPPLPSDHDEVAELAKRQGAPDVGTLTSFFGYDGCENYQKTAIMKAQNDANYLASRAVSYPPIDWGNSPAVLEYFGPADETAKGNIRQHIIDQFNGAAKSYPGVGWSDYWNDRYVTLKCADKSDSECPKAAAYTRSQSHHDKYPTIVFCPNFFGPSRPSLDDAKERVKKHPELKAWASALQSQGTTFMHELFHIDFGKAQISNPPCKDQPISIGPQGHRNRTRAYKPGRAKLLAASKAHGPRSATENNDSLVYYAVAAYMTSIYDNVYPAKPRAWNPELSWEDNEKDNTEPTFDGEAAAEILEGNDADDDTDSDVATELTKDSLFDSSAYPAAYIAKYGKPGGDPPLRVTFTGTATPVTAPPTGGTGIVTAGG